MKYVFVVLALALVPHCHSWEPFHPQNKPNWPNGWQVQTHETGRYRYGSKVQRGLSINSSCANCRWDFALARPGPVRNANYVLWVMFNPSNGKFSKLIT